MSKTASAREEPNLFELFRAPKVFEAKPQIAHRHPDFCPFDDAKLGTKKEQRKETAALWEFWRELVGV